MEIRIWQSFSCNNSSSYRLVARFSDPKVAKDSEAELTRFFKEHAEEADKRMEESDYEWDGYYNPTETFKTLAKRYGFEAKQGLVWGDEGLTGDEPTVAAAGDVLAIYHTYCGGFGKDLEKYFTARGAKVEKEERDAPTISVIFKLPSDAKKAKAISKELGSIFAQADTHGYVRDWKKRLPWAKPRGRGGIGASEETAFFCDNKSIGFFLPIDPTDLTPIRDYLRGKGISDPAVRLCSYGDKDAFKLVRTSKCDACGNAPLEYLEGGEQLGCGKCGGMFELKTLLAAKKKEEKRQEKAAAKLAAAEAEAAEAKAKLKKKAASKKTSTSKTTKAKAKPKAKAKTNAKTKGAKKKSR